MFPALDAADDPATLSHPILTGILRERTRLRRRGGHRLARHGGRTRRSTATTAVPVLALKAGVDQLLNPPALDVAWNARPERRTGRRAHRGPARRVDPAHPAAQGEAGLFERPVRQPRRGRPDRRHPRRTCRRRPDRRAHHDPAGQRGRRCCRCRRRTHRKLLVVGADPASPSGTTGPPTGRPRRAPSTELGFTATALSTGTAPVRGEDRRGRGGGARTGRGGRRHVQRRRPTSTQKTLVERLLATGVPVVALAIRNPYDVAHLPASGPPWPPTPGPTSNCAPPHG